MLFLSTTAPGNASFSASSCVRKTFPGVAAAMTAMASARPSRERALVILKRRLEEIAKPDVPLIDAGRSGVLPLLPVELDGDLLDRFEDGPDCQQLDVVGRVAVIARGHLRLGVVSLVADERSEGKARARPQREDVESRLQIPAPLPASHRLVPLEAVDLVDGGRVGD